MAEAKAEALARQVFDAITQDGWVVLSMASWKYIVELRDALARGDDSGIWSALANLLGGSSQQEKCGPTYAKALRDLAPALDAVYGPRQGGWDFPITCAAKPLEEKDPVPTLAKFPEPIRIRQPRSQTRKQLVAIGPARNGGPKPQRANTRRHRRPFK